VDVASLDPAVRTKLAQGQTVTLTARGGQGDVLTATDVQPDTDAKTAATFQRVSGTVQESGKQRVLFKTADGLVLPVDVSKVHGLPYLAANQPATLYYEQGPKQEILAVWIEPGTAASATTGSQPSGAATSPPSGAATSQPSASPTPPSPAPAASVGQSLQGKVQTIGMSTLTVQTNDGKTVTVDTSGVDQQSVASVRPGDSVTVTGTATADGGRFAAQSVKADR
jgi:translation initiation factor IF-1